MRPRYETKADLRRERGVLAEVERVWASWNCLGTKRKPSVNGLGHIDFRLSFDGMWFLCAEIKTRRNDLRRYTTYSISALKPSAAKRLPVPALMIVQFTDGIKWAPFSAPHELHMGGRRDRGDPRDIELMAHYHVDLFHPLSVAPHTVGV